MSECWSNRVPLCCCSDNWSCFSYRRCSSGGGDGWIGWCWRRCHLARSSAVDHLNVEATVALLTLNLAVVLILLAAISRRRAFRWLIVDGDLRRCLPAWNLPNHTSETLNFETTLLPFAAWLARSIERPKTSIDRPLVGFGTQFVGSAIRGSGNGGRVIDGAILPI
jgi:hypothetical protein